MREEQRFTPRHHYDLGLGPPKRGRSQAPQTLATIQLAGNIHHINQKGQNEGRRTEQRSPKHPDCVQDQFAALIHVHNLQNDNDNETCEGDIVHCERGLLSFSKLGIHVAGQEGQDDPNQHHGTCE